MRSVSSSGARPVRSPKIYDAVIVGSGASGGWAAKRLAEAGLHVALLDAGRQLTDADYREHLPAAQLPFRNLAPELIRRVRPVQSDCYACSEYNASWFCNDLEEPYSTPAGLPFSWQGRTRVIGGRTNVWGRWSLRFSDLDFHAARRDGYGADWPLDYRDLAPYYDRVERYIGVSGERERDPYLPDGQFLPAMPLTCAERRFRDRVRARLGRTATIGRLANLTRPLHGRAPCHYCGPCERGCVTHSYFNAAFTTVADALATGRCALIPDAMAYRVEMDLARHRAHGVAYLDRQTRQAREIRGRVVILCAQALESCRILLNSANRQDANGLANSSGALGRYLMDHVYKGGGATGEFPGLPPDSRPFGPYRPNGQGLYVARFRNTRTHWPAFLRGYGVYGWSGAGPAWASPGYGNAYLQALRGSQTPTALGLAAYGECLARWSNFVELDRDRVDAFGIPVLRIHMRFGENELAMCPDMAASCGEMLAAAGARNISTWSNPRPVPGWSIHEVGVARMGRSPRDSVLNSFQQTHDVANLFVMDGSGFPSSACQNPTLTIMALALRSCDYLLGRMRRAEL